MGRESTVGTGVGTTRFRRYAKRMQLWGEVSRDGVLVVLIHKQRCAACLGYVCGRWCRGDESGLRGGGSGRGEVKWVWLMADQQKSRCEIFDLALGPGMMDAG